MRYILLGLRTETPEEKQVNPTDQKIEARTIEIAWNDLNNYIRSSKFKVDVVLTPPKVWFEKTLKFKIYCHQSMLYLFAKYIFLSKT